MKRKSIDPYHWDPIAFEQQQRERDCFLSDLFLPIVKELQHQETEWLVQDLIPQGYLCLLAAGPKQGKTSLATALALAVATGRPFAGRPTSQGAVLWIAAEESRRERALLLDQSPLVDTTLPLYTCHQHLPIDDEDCLDAINHWRMKTDAKLIVVDPLQAATSGRSLEGGWNARRSLQALKKFCDLHQVAALVLHHQKQARYGLHRARAAENDQLSATAALVMSMRVRKMDEPPPPFRGTPITSDRQTASEMEEGAGGGGLENSGGTVNGASPREERLPRRREIADRGVGGGQVADPGEAQSKIGSGGTPAESQGIQQPSKEAIKKYGYRETGKPGNLETPRSSRIIALECAGRGDFANETIWLTSDGPLDYQSFDGPHPEKPQKLDYVGHREEEVLRVLLKRPKRSDQILDRVPNISPGTVRNCLTRLRYKGYVIVKNWRDGGRYFTLTPEGRKHAKNVAPG